ncbi:MAG: hypothetical protein Q4G36_11955 [Paracoccus sp. (in: a-proteobacteria)]|nr:hypothetical protein [Paracoccus sp. (in: a-proteobacteria)]
MAEPSRQGVTAGIAPRIPAAWVRPGRVIRGLAGMSESAMLAVLMGAMLVFLIAQMPVHARAAHLAPEIPFAGRMAGATVAVLFMMPLIAYLVAALSAVVLRLFGLRVSAADARLALFWALLAVSPAMLLAGLVAGFIGPGVALGIVQAISGVGFLWIWGAGLRALAVRR